MLTLLVGLLLGLASSTPVHATTALDLSDRIEIDGFSDEFELGEEIFGDAEEPGVREESTQDSRWGTFNDLNQIKITWDKDSLYVAVDAVIFDNNTMLFFDITNRSPDTNDDDGLTAMTDVNSWRRNFVFSPDFTPDLFLATWDGNSQPQLWTYTGPNQVEQITSTEFRTVATFDKSSSGRSMEAAIPWSIFFLGESEQVQNSELGAEVWTVPAGMDTLRFAGVITAGPDGTGGPDSAPDNFGGHTVESSDQVTIDNFAILPFDLEAPDGIPDFGIDPRDRIEFKRRPPIRGLTFEISELSFVDDHTVVSPEEDRSVSFEVSLSPRPTEDEDFRTVTFTAKIYDSLGKLVRILYKDDPRPAIHPSNPELDQWDGRDNQGRMVPGGIYILSVVSEPGLSRITKALGVVR